VMLQGKTDPELKRKTIGGGFNSGTLPSKASMASSPSFLSRCPFIRCHNLLLSSHTLTLLSMAQSVPSTLFHGRPLRLLLPGTLATDSGLVNPVGR